MTPAERAREIVERLQKLVTDIARGQAEGWYENPKKDGCGGGIAASNTGYLISKAIEEIQAIRSRLPPSTPEPEAE